MSATTPKSDLLRGFVAGLPYIIVVVPFSTLFGVIATEAGLPLSQVIAFSLVVVAGASQFTALQFMSESAPVFVVLASALAVNLRMAMYSAAMVPHVGAAPLWQRATIAYFLVDQGYALSHEEFEKRPDMTLRQKLAYFTGATIPVVPLWFICTWIGALVGAAIPAEYGLDFIVPIAFLAMVGPALRTPAHIAAAFVSIVTALALVSLPFNLGLMVAALLGMMTGAEIERRSE